MVTITQLRHQVRNSNGTTRLLLDRMEQCECRVFHMQLTWFPKHYDAEQEAIMTG